MAADEERLSVATMESLVDKGSVFDPLFSGTPSCWNSNMFAIQWRHDGEEEAVPDSAVLRDLTIISDPPYTPDLWENSELEREWNTRLTQAQSSRKPPTTRRNPARIWERLTPFITLADSNEGRAMGAFFQELLESDIPFPLPLTLHGHSGTMSARAA